MGFQGNTEDPFPNGKQGLRPQQRTQACSMHQSSFSRRKMATALHSSHQEQLISNVDMLDQLYHRSPTMPKRRLIMAIDHTYLEPVLVQARIKGVAGTIGGPWSPGQEEHCFVETGSVDRATLKVGRATMMLECLVWDPESTKKQCYSLASMPMSLKRSKKVDMTLVKEGNLDSRL